MEWFTIPEIAYGLNMSEKKIRKAIDRGELRAYKPHERSRAQVEKSQLVTWLYKEMALSQQRISEVILRIRGKLLIAV